ncbi:pentatricopeptide repeat-containing protein At5g67570, chloroplastic isoform X2 [Amborella trichopoda]|uniref:pentatricopeptide repeat-containing protein At5g67570, chloroplastic isoform X2 n=1 Tax=Amborella trichopoda TaxID=13333 RepID=UPI0009C07A72|nr:pentatricopeptide repeat-containing protein At5g67570, chloroplastic isoform X2 [Amborella trichopoda]|eukprot:XP_020520883.1 pentatricopeptide repeat-containing protein At5g67570, chloroplastic isoform X2 [Amborella trichopoda]
MGGVKGMRAGSECLFTGLGAVGNWMQALFVVEWVYKTDHYKHHKSRFVYTKLLAVLGKARRPSEALDIFNEMREDYFLYPDMAAYHSIAVTLGQAGQVKELLKVIDYMRQRPSKKALNVQRKSWNPCLEPDVVIYNAVLNACVPCGDWKGVFWVLGQMRHSGLKPSGATYGLAMEVMLKSGKYDLVHKFFGTMRRGGLAPKALTYKVLVSCLWAEGKVNEAVEAVEDMERRGVVGTASVYYELACCLCNNGRWKEAMTQIEKLKSLPLSRPLEVAFTGMIQSCMDGGYVRDGISIFENMQEYCTLNIGTINVMLKLYGCNDMFTKAKELFEGIKMPEARYDMNLDCHGVNSPDAYTYSLMLEASAISLQWEYFEHVYKEMALSGFQLDQNKHAWLLVEASRAGMMHLLEHAFDSALEAGELPHWSIFTEMICQTLICHDFKRAITLVNSMAHVSLQVSEKQWTNLFKRNSDKISIEELQKLRQCLNDKGLMSEPIVTNLSKSLCYLCGSNIPTEYALCDVTTKLSTFSEEDRDVSFNGDECFSLEENVEDIFDPLPELSRFRIDESGLDDYGSFEHAFEGSELPSASEILERWKEGEMKDANCTQSML